MTRRLLLVAVLTGLSARAHATYAPGCTVTLNVAGALRHEARAVAIQPDGKIVVAGYAEFAPGNLDVLVARFHPDLSPDTSFNGTGYRVDDIQTRDDEWFAVAISTDQKIVVSGYSRKNPAQVEAAFARYNRDGSLDTTFGPGGFSRIDIGGSNDRFRAVAIQPDGMILGAGFTMSGTQKLAVVRLRKDGSLDTAFDIDGAVSPTLAGSSSSVATGVRVQPDGKIVVSGQARFATDDFIAVRFRTDGSLDVGFNTMGWVATDVGAGSVDSASSLVLLADGRIDLSGTSNANPAVVRYNSGGTLDTSFGGTGKVVHDFGGTDTGNASALDAAGNVIVAGETLTAGYDFAFSRFRPNGMPDLTKIDDVSFMDDRAYAVAITRVGKILVAGTSQAPSSPKTTLALYLPNGNQDCGPPVYPVDVFTAASSGDSVNGQVMLNWLNPSYGPYNRTVIRRDIASCPATENDGVLVANQSDGPGNPGSFVDTVPLGPTYHYSAFVLDATSQASTGVCRSATPFDRTAGKIEWSYGTSIAALTTPGLRLNTGMNESTAYTVSNDGVVHAIRGGPVAAGGGSWPVGYRPFQTFSPAPSRPPVVPIPPSAKLAVLIGSQDGYVHALDAATGALMWKSPNLGTTIVAAPAVVLSAWGGGANLVFVGTREAGQPNRFYALNADDGTVAWKFDNGGGVNGIGMIVGSASVDYVAKRVYFTSAQGASGKTTWCLNYLSTPPTNCWATAGVNPGGGDVEASPILNQGSLFVSETLAGDLYAVNPLDGSSTLFFPLLDAGAKGFVFPQFGTANVLASTATSTTSVGFGSQNWVENCGASPSTPVAPPFTDWVFVGTNDGKLFQLSASSGGGCAQSACVGNCSSTIVGAPAYDVLKTMLYVGTDDGILHALRPPF